MIPVAISLSGDGAWRQPMGIVVIGGLILSTMLTLLIVPAGFSLADGFEKRVIVPAGFSLADGFEKRVGPILRNKLLTYKPGDDTRPHAEPDLPFPGLPGGAKPIPARRLPPGAEPAE